MDAKLKALLLVLFILFSIGLLYKLGYMDGWNDRSVAGSTYCNTTVLRGEEVNR